MSDQPTRQVFPVEGEAFALMQKYKSELDALKATQESIQEEYLTKLESAVRVHEAKLREIWFRMTALVGLDPTKSWRNREYNIEASYLDYGFGAIIYMKQEDEMNPILAALGMEAPEDDSSKDETPLSAGLPDDKSKLN